MIGDDEECDQTRRRGVNRKEQLRPLAQGERHQHRRKEFDECRGQNEAVGQQPRHSAVPNGKATGNRKGGKEQQLEINYRAQPQRP